MKFALTKRTWLRAAAVLAALGLATVLATLEPVDYSPYLKSDYYKTTLERLERAGSDSAVAKGELQAGFGRALLTPELRAGTNLAATNFASVPLAGYGNRKGKPATGVHDDVYVKAVALKVGNRFGVMVGADALIIPREVAERAVVDLARQPGLGREQIYFGATHTHSSLGGWGKGFVAEGFAGSYDARLSQWFSARLVEAVRAALADLQPAAAGAGGFSAPELIRNRLVGKLGAEDPEFRFEVVKQTATGRLGVIGSYGAHATVLSGKNLEFSGDYPGYWERAMEQATGGLALFLAGGVGSHSPNAGAPGFEGAERMGKQLAELLQRQLPSVVLTNVVSFGLRGLEVTLPPLHARLTDQVRLRPWLAKELLPVFPSTFLQAFRLDNAVWISTPCDFSGELALALKATARARGFDCVVTSFNGDYIGYIIPARYYHLSGYEPRLMSFYGPYSADYLQDLIEHLATSLARSEK